MWDLSLTKVSLCSAWLSCRWRHTSLSPLIYPEVIARLMMPWLNTSCHISKLDSSLNLPPSSPPIFCSNWLPSLYWLFFPNILCIRLFCHPFPNIIFLVQESLSFIDNCNNLLILSFCLLSIFLRYCPYDIPKIQIMVWQHAEKLSVVFAI